MRNRAILTDEGEKSTNKYGDETGGNRFNMRYHLI